MSSTLMVPALGCVLQIAEVQVDRQDGAWIESLRLEIGADPGCTFVDIPLPPQVTVSERGGRVVLGDGRRSRVDEARFADMDRRLDGLGVVRVHLPDLVGGDRAIVEIERTWDRPDAYVWRPEGARWATLSSKAPIWQVAGARHEERRGEAWVEQAGPEVMVQLAVDDTSPWANPHTGLLPPSRPPEQSRALTLEVPKVDPQRALYPGGGSTVRVQDRLSFAAEDRVRAWHIPARGVSDLSVRITPSADAAAVETRDDGLLVVIAASEGPADVLLDYRLPDAPTFGEVDPGIELTVSVPGGHLRWQDERFWSLVDVHERPILPAHEALLKALDRRFRVVAIPEPGLPTNLRGRKATWDLAEDLVPTLYERALPAPLDQSTLLPRPLARARRSGVLTEIEAGLITWLYGLQARLETGWLLVRSAASGPGGAVNLSGFDHMLVQIGAGESARWLDPGCIECAPWEVRPELEGGDILALPGLRGPDPTPGEWSMVVQSDRIAWEASGPAALELRRWLTQFPEADRDVALAEAVGGAGAELLDARGLEPGATLSVLASRGSGAFALPLDAPPTRSDATTWIPWIGTRTVRLDDPAASMPTAYSGDAVDLEVDVDARTVTMRVRQRLIGETDAAALAQAARQVRMAPVTP
jgi:hypothetical protein